MAKERSSPTQNADVPAAEHVQPAASEPVHGPSYTAWHPLLAQVLVRVLASPALEVHPFVKLGTLPLEADIILLRKNTQTDLLAQFPEFGFLLRFLQHYLLIEYKSPLDRLTCDDFDTARAYAMLCKRKYDIAQDSHVAVALLYSQAEPAFFATTHDNGYAFVEKETGIWACEQHPLRLYAIDLVAFGATDPEHPINLFSKRHRTYRPTDPRWETLLGSTYSAIRREMQLMQTRLRGQEELNQSVSEMIQNFLRELPPEERLRGLPAEERLRGLPAEERLRGLGPEDLRRLPAEERQRLRDLLELADPKSPS
jgi:hypothetical protein